jgi:ParB-like chromosome segregation protein Spo0J
MGSITPSQRMRLKELGVGGNIGALTSAAADQLIPNEFHEFERIEDALENSTMTDEIANDIGVAKYEFHPLADLFPLVEGAAFEELVADIEEHGLADPIVLFEDKILDGRNRYRAMVQLGFDDHVVRRHSEQFEKGDPLAFVISKNLKRRHLNDDQRRMVGAKIANLPVGANQHTAECGTLTRAKAAELLNTDAAGIERARTVIRTAEPEIQNAVEQGKLTVNLAAQASKLTAEQQREIAAKAEAGEANVVRTAVKKARRAQREVEPQPAKVDTNSETANTAKSAMTAEETAAERKEAYARDDAPSSPAPPASTRETDDALAKHPEEQPATLEELAELGTKKKPKVKPEPYRDQWLDWTIAVEHLSELPECGLGVLASREPDQIELLRQQCADALTNLNLWNQTLEKSHGGQEAENNAA